MSFPRPAPSVTAMLAIVVVPSLLLVQPTLAQPGFALHAVAEAGFAHSAALLATEAAGSESAADEDHGQGDGDHGSSRLTSEEIPLQIEGFPKRPKPILELGPHFLGTGTLGDGFKLPTGAIWQPAFLAFGQLRTAVQTFDNGSDSITEAVARLDLFGNLQLSGSERIVIGFRNFDENGMFTSYIIDSDRPGVSEGSRDAVNSQMTSLFFEGEFGEIFPNLSKNDFRSTDWGFSIGRQPLLFQEGLLINDVVDGIGLTRNTLLPHGTANFRVTFFSAWENLDRTDRTRGRRSLEDRSAEMYALLTSTDFRWSTMDIDAAYVVSDFGDLLIVGVSAVQRIGLMNSSFRVLSSFADEETNFATDGTLLFSELSWTPHHTHNLIYVNAFWAIDDFASASRDPATGGPLGRAGINFAAVGLGNYGAPLSNQARAVAGGAFGFQMFFDHTRKQVITELGVRIGTDDLVENQAAATVRYQQAIGKHFVAIVDGSVGYREGLGVAGDDTTLFGARLELLTKF